jgi:flagellar biogenesis protein FliO
MTDVSFVDLVVRMVLSLAVVLGLMFGAYWILRRRQGFGPISSPRPRRVPSRLPGRSPGTLRLGAASFGSAARHAGHRRGLRVVGRVGVGRTTQVVAVQFAERVFLLAASDQAAPAVLAELDLAEWLASTESAETNGVEPTVHGAGPRSATGSLSSSMHRDMVDPTIARPQGLLESLREATARRG